MEIKALWLKYGTIYNLLAIKKKVLTEISF